MFYRQGDVVLKKVRALPEGMKEIADRTLARGEATGHAHVVDGDVVVFADAESQRLFVQVMSTATVVHEEHATIPLKKGIYEVIGQRTYTPEGIQRVLD